MIFRMHLVWAVGGPVVLLADPALDHALRRLLLQQLQQRLFVLSSNELHENILDDDGGLRLGATAVDILNLGRFFLGATALVTSIL